MSLIFMHLALVGDTWVIVLLIAASVVSIGVMIDRMLVYNKNRGDLATLVRLTAAGRLHPEIGVLLPWEHTPDVIDAIRQRRLRGNAVLTLN